ncbi:MAG: hypothetical protein WC223_11335 [Bacteroidales bacterium]|jgi:hypothetical protein
MIEHITLTDFKEKEIHGISGKGVSFKKIRIPDENCSNFLIWYDIINQKSGEKFSGPIDCLVSPYQRDVSQVTLYKSIIIPDNCTLFIQVKSILKKDFKGTSYIDFEIFTPTSELEKKSGVKVFISENDRQNAFKIALTNLARFFNIPNWEYDDNQALYNKIELLNITIVKFLQDYFKAYNEWFNFYERIKNIENTTGQGYNLTDTERNELDELIKNRENTLNSLQEEFDKLQFEKFKKENGLENVDGIIS